MSVLQFTCSECGTSLDLTLNDQGICTCSRCQSQWQFHLIFPAETGPSLEERLPQPRSDSETATCYNHPDNLAKNGCDNCGRFVCAVCCISVEGRNVCPACRDGGKSFEWSPFRQETQHFAFSALVAGAWGGIFLITALAELAAGWFLSLDPEDRSSCLSLSAYLAGDGGSLVIVSAMMVFFHFSSQLAVYENRKVVPVSSIICIVITVGLGIGWIIIWVPEFIRSINSYR